MEPRRNNNNNSNDHYNFAQNPSLHRVSTNQNDRVIKTSGKYNLDFIDWNNEYEAIFSGVENDDDPNNPFPGYNIPYGVSEAFFAAEIASMQQEAEDDGRTGLSEEFLNMIKPMKMKKSSKECSVCCHSFNDGEIIRRLPCKHMFHNKCLMPWLEKHVTCPNCRLNLEEFFTKYPNN